MRRSAFQGLRSLFSRKAREGKGALAKRRDDDELRVEEAARAALRQPAAEAREAEKKADGGDGDGDGGDGGADEAMPQPGRGNACANGSDTENLEEFDDSDLHTNYAIPVGISAQEYYKRLWRAELEKRLRLEEELREQKALNRRNAERQRNERIRAQERQRTAQRSREKAEAFPSRSLQKTLTYAATPDDAQPEKHSSNDDFGMDL